jgi:hypothetical protein
MRRLLIAACIAAVVTFAIATSASAAWYQYNRFGAYYLQEPCCGGDTLNGTGASIEVYTASPDSSSCLLFRSSAENSSYLIQSGLVRCNNYSVDYTCGTAGTLVFFVETEVNGSYSCYQHGSASYNTTYTATPQNASGNLWYAYINGNSYESNTFVASVIGETNEHNGPNANTCGSWSGDALYANSSTWPWERYVIGSLTWKKVQSSDTWSGCWTRSGAPPSSFEIYR